MAVVVGDAGDQGCEVVAGGRERLDDDAAAFLAHVDGLVQAHAGGFQHGGRDAHGGAVAPFLHDALHGGPRCRCFYIVDTGRGGGKGAVEPCIAVALSANVRLWQFVALRILVRERRGYLDEPPPDSEPDGLHASASDRNWPGAGRQLWNGWKREADIRRRSPLGSFRPISDIQLFTPRALKRIWNSVAFRSLPRIWLKENM